jgi:hypothetical protein
MVEVDPRPLDRCFSVRALRLLSLQALSNHWLVKLPGTRKPRTEFPDARLKFTDSLGRRRRYFLDICRGFRYVIPHRTSLSEGRFLDAILKVERVRFLRAVSQTALGRSGYHKQWTQFAQCKLPRFHCYALRHYDRGARCLA